MSIPKGQRLCEQCSTRGWLYYILEGVAKVYLTTTDGNEHIVDFMKADTLIGMDCIDGGNRSVVSISGVTELRVLPFTPDMLRELILKNPELGFDLVVYYGEVLRQVAFMVGRLLGVKPDWAVDASDALGVAVCHLNMRRQARLMTR